MKARWLGRQDSNLGSRDQNPLPYHLATPHRLGPSIGAGMRGAYVRSVKRKISAITARTATATIASQKRTNTKMTTSTAST